MNRIKVKCVSTWIYVVLVTVILACVTVCAAIVKESTIRLISIASESEYKLLLSSKLDRLACTCSRISIGYQELVSVETLFHVLCSSDFVKDFRLDYLFTTHSIFEFVVLLILVSCAVCVDCIKQWLIRIKNNISVKISSAVN
jgi:hypothetical protein